jgi:hypothetical protein
MWMIPHENHLLALVEYIPSLCPAHDVSSLRHHGYLALELRSMPPIMIDLGTMWNGSWIVATMLQVNRKYSNMDFPSNRLSHHYINIAILISQRSEDLNLTLKVDPTVKEVADIPGFSRLTLCIGKIINSNTHFKKV